MKRNLIRCICWLVLFSICLIAGCNTPTNESPALTPTPDMQAAPSQTISGGNVNADEPTPEPTKEVLLVEKLKTYEAGRINPTMYKYIEEYPAYSNTQSLDIPVYDHQCILSLNYENYDSKEEFYDDWIVHLGTDRSYTMIEQSIGAQTLAALLTRIPKGAIRIIPDNNIGYIMHDTDRGVRIFHFFTVSDGKASGSGSTITGHVALMSDKLSYPNYKDIKKGDELSSLAAIDPAMQVYADYFYGTFSFAYGDNVKPMLESRKEYGIPLSTVSILSDGALKIGLDYIDDKFVVDTIEFSENFTLECYGGEICYRIAPVDYVE